MNKTFVTVPFFAAALMGFSANAVDIKPFIGGNLSINGVAYSDDCKDATDSIGVDLPTSFWGIGAEAGVKFEMERIYNAALVFSYDYAFNKEAEMNTGISDYVSAKIGFSALSMTFDNYLRVSGNDDHRQDIILGIGMARATERVDIKFTSYMGLDDINEKDDGNAVVFKIGYNYKITNHVDWYLNGRWFVPTNSDSDIGALFNANAGIRFLF